MNNNNVGGDIMKTLNKNEMGQVKGLGICHCYNGPGRCPIAVNIFKNKTLSECYKVCCKEALAKFAVKIEWYKYGGATPIEKQC